MKLSRRRFLLDATAAGAAIALGHWRPVRTQAQVPAHRVVHVHSNEATNWNYATGWYGDYVSQPVVDMMTGRGVMALTNTATLGDAWRALIPSFVAGQIVAIKINLNNASCGDDDQVIDALPQPINSVIRGLKAIGVAESNIWVYDVARGSTIMTKCPARGRLAATSRPTVCFSRLTRWRLTV